MLTEVAAEAHARDADGVLSVSTAVDDRSAVLGRLRLDARRTPPGTTSGPGATVFERTFGHAVPLPDGRAAARESTGCCRSSQINSLLFGRTMTSLPFVNYGGVLATSADAGEALLAAAVREASAGAVPSRRAPALRPPVSLTCRASSTR